MGRFKKLYSPLDVKRFIDVVLLIYDADKDGITAESIRNNTGIPRASAWRILTELVDAGFVGRESRARGAGRPEEVYFFSKFA